MGMEATSLSRILKSMEEKDLIYRQKNPNDGRGVLIFLTAFGKSKREDAKKAVIEFNQEILNRVSPEQMESFFGVMETINNLVAEQKIYQENT